MIRTAAAGAVIRLCFASIIAVRIFFLFADLRAQDPQSEQTPAPPDAETGLATEPIPVMFPHPEIDRLWISGQANIISQWHPYVSVSLLGHKQPLRAGTRRQFPCSDFVHRPAPHRKHGVALRR